MALLALIALLGAGGTWEAWRRSTIPLAFDTRVEARVVRFEKHPGSDDVHILRIGGRDVRVDHAVFEQVPDGARIAKRRWSHVLRVDERDVRIAPSGTTRGMAMVTLIVVAFATFLSLRRR